MSSARITQSPSLRWALPGAVAASGTACAIMIALDLDSPVRAVVALAFLGLGPGLAVVGLLQIRDPVQQVALAVAASFAIDTVVAVTLLYLEAYSVGLAFAIVAAFTAVALVLGALRGRTSPPSDPPRDARPGADDRGDHAALRERLARYTEPPPGHADA